MKEIAKYTPQWTITKYASDKAFECGVPYEQKRFEGNLLLNEGITALLNLLTGGTETAFNNANTYIGVGDSDTAAAATQTGLQGTSKTYKGMEATYPVISGQKVTFRAVFGADDGNHSWKEFSVVNGNSDAADNLNRKVDAQGTKAQGQTWTLDLEITFS